MVKFCNFFVYLLMVLKFEREIFCSELGFCNKERTDCDTQINQDYKYILYDVNPPEGFNLRRDVYMRYAIFSHKLKLSKDKNLRQFKLVLPPWSYLYHWKRRNEPENIPWSTFFDLESLQKFAPVIEMHQFFKEMNVKYTNVKIDEVYILQHFKDMFETGKFEERLSIEKCYEKYPVNFFYYSNITSNNIRCLSFHGHASHLSSILSKLQGRVILFVHAEVALHDRFGDEIYWQCRRSMRFNKDLTQIAKEFRQIYFDANDEMDKTILPDDWTKEKYRRNAIGGPYLSVHLRRKDFLRGRPKDVPSIKNAAKQIVNKLLELNLTNVFIATDATRLEIEELKSLLKPSYELLRYVPESWVEDKFKDGGCAIIEQIICSYGQYFIGTHESTFSFRIQEEREILGFSPETTFNRFCGDNDDVCEKPSFWKIVY